jgi:hypothetical protein
MQMTADNLALLDRSLSRAFDEHVGILQSVLNDAITVIEPMRRATVRDSLEQFKKNTLRVINDYHSRVQQEIFTLANGVNIVWTADTKSTILSTAEKYLDPALYMIRFAAYESSVTRHMSRFVAQVQLSDYRFDLTKSTYEVASLNATSKFLTALGDEMEIKVQHQSALQTMSSQENNSQPATQNHYNTIISGTAGNIAVGSSNVQQQAQWQHINDHVLFAKLLDTIATAQLQQPLRSQVSNAIEELKASQGTSAFKEKYHRFMGILADHMQVLGPVVAPLLAPLAAMMV